MVNVATAIRLRYLEQVQIALAGEPSDSKGDKTIRRGNETAHFGNAAADFALLECDLDDPAKTKDTFDKIYGDDFATAPKIVPKTRESRATVAGLKQNFSGKKNTINLRKSTAKSQHRSKTIIGALQRTNL